jgi:3-mercaptopyruvate sulfurtransferase SseA
MKLLHFSTLAIATVFAHANTVDITAGLSYVKVEAPDGKIYKIKRVSTPNTYLTNTYALTSRPSPPFFVQPFKVTDGVETFGELELLDFVSKKKGIFIDARLPNWYYKHAIPGARNIPFKLFLSPSKKLDHILESFGAVKKNGSWDFSEAKTLLLYCNGAWCGQSPTAIHALAKLGYPKEKMKYYRGGMQSWQLLGLTTIVPTKEKK